MKSKKENSFGTKPKITNIVATGRFPKEIDIVKVYPGIDFLIKEYEPETYPALLVKVEVNGNHNDLIGCEVGVKNGFNLKPIMLNLPIKKLYAIDIDLSINTFHDDRIVFIEADSVDAAIKIPDGSLDFCYIDIANEFRKTVKEIGAYIPKIKKGGIIAGHNFNNKNVSCAVFECFNFEEIHDGEDWWVKIV